MKDMETNGNILKPLEFRKVGNGLKNIKKLLIVKIQKDFLRNNIVNMVGKKQKKEKDVKDVEQHAKGMGNKFKDISLNLFNE